MGRVQATVSWSTDVLIAVMFPTGPGEAGEERSGEAIGMKGGGRTIVAYQRH